MAIKTASGSDLRNSLSSGLVLLNTTSFSGVTSQSFTYFNATYKNYLVILYLQQCVNAGNLGIRMRSVATDDTGTNYNAACLGTDTSATVDIRSAGLTSLQFLNTGAGANYEWNGTIFFGNPFETKVTNIVTGVAGRRNGGNYASYHGGGVHTLTNSYDGFTLLNSSGGNIQGVVSIYGVNA